jgi:uncharacterized membrane protein
MLLWIAGMKLTRVGIAGILNQTSTLLVPLLAAVFLGERLTRRKVLALALGVGALFLAARAGNPAIYWGEKPMDFAFLNAFLDAPAWPPGEPWMAGMPLHYYYFGEVLAGFGLALARRRSWFAALALPLLVLLSGNLAWPWLLEHARDGRWFDLWWATSRVIPGFAIDEYPLWTALFADLHGHFVALPVLLTTLGWGWLAE